MSDIQNWRISFEKLYRINTIQEETMPIPGLEHLDHYVPVTGRIIKAVEASDGDGCLVTIISSFSRMSYTVDIRDIEAIE